MVKWSVGHGKRENQVNEKLLKSQEIQSDNRFYFIWHLTIELFRTRRSYVQLRNAAKMKKKMDALIRWKRRKYKTSNKMKMKRGNESGILLVL